MATKRSVEGIKIERAYEASAAEDGYRVLIDRLWPRGIKKEELRFDEWNKDVAPSDELRRWFGHDPAKWTEFSRRYRSELRGKTAVLDELIKRSAGASMTLLYAAKDQEHNNAVILRDVLEKRSREPASTRRRRTRSTAKSVKARRRPSSVTSTRRAVNTKT